MPANSSPYNLHQTLIWKVRNFSDNVYNFNEGDKLTTLMRVLLSDSGVGFLSDLQTSSQLTQNYPIFSDLEQILGTLLNSARTSQELYNFSLDPFTDQLSQEQWRQVLDKDSSYRERLLSTSFALLKGATSMGLQSLAEGTSGVKFQVIENWTTASGNLPAGWSRGLGGAEVVLVPLVPSGVLYNADTRYAVSNTVQQLVPVNIAVTVVSSTVNSFSNVKFTTVSTNSEFFYFDREVTANNIELPATVANTQDPSITSRYWLSNNVPTDAPLFAYTLTQEQIVDQTANLNNAQDVVNTTWTTDPIGAPTVQMSSLPLGG